MHGRTSEESPRGEGAKQHLKAARLSDHQYTVLLHHHPVARHRHTTHLRHSLSRPPSDTLLLRQTTPNALRSPLATPLPPRLPSPCAILRSLAPPPHASDHRKSTRPPLGSYLRSRSKSAWRAGGNRRIRNARTECSTFTQHGYLRQRRHLPGQCGVRGGV